MIEVHHAWLCTACTYQETIGFGSEGKFKRYNRMIDAIGVVPVLTFGLWEAARLLAGHDRPCPDVDDHALVATVLERHGVHTWVGRHPHYNALCLREDQVTGPDARKWCEVIERAVVGIPDMLAEVPQTIDTRPSVHQYFYR